MMDRVQSQRHYLESVLNTSVISFKNVARIVFKKIIMKMDRLLLPPAS